MVVNPVVIDSASTTERRLRLQRRAQLLAGASVAYNAIEAVVAVGAGIKGFVVPWKGMFFVLNYGDAGDQLWLRLGSSVPGASSAG